jgi:hypothetical protein
MRQRSRSEEYEIEHLDFFAAEKGAFRVNIAPRNRLEILSLCHPGFAPGNGCAPPSAVQKVIQKPIKASLLNTIDAASTHFPFSSSVKAQTSISCYPKVNHAIKLLKIKELFL